MAALLASLIGCGDDGRSCSQRLMRVGGRQGGATTGGRHQRRRVEPSRVDDSGRSGRRHVSLWKVAPPRTICGGGGCRRTQWRMSMKAVGTLGGVAFLLVVSGASLAGQIRRVRTLPTGNCCCLSLFGHDLAAVWVCNQRAVAIARWHRRRRCDLKIKSIAA